MRRASPEQQIHRAVMQHLRARGQPGVFAFHVPNGGKRSPIEAAIFKSLGVVAGIPDVLIIKQGRLYALELKAAKGKLTQAQMLTHTQMQAAGAIVATAVGLDAALEQLEVWGLLRPDASRRDYDPTDDLRQSVNLCLATVKERMAKGGPAWPKDESA
jgi:hypothetical protein